MFYHGQKVDILADRYSPLVCSFSSRLSIFSALPQGSMFLLAILIGGYAYTIFGLGIAGLLKKELIFLATVLWGLISICIFRKLVIKKPLFRFSWTLFLIVIQVLVNLIGALGPELAFDALWYHLTLPKIFLQEQRIFYIPGGLYYYSVIPKLTEMLYLVALSLGNEIWAKLIHFCFGILAMIALYKLSRKYLSASFSLLVILIFYSNLVVGWQSITAYIDLARTFFEVMTLLAFLHYVEKKEKRWIAATGAMLGLAVSTKIVALGSVGLWTALFLIINKKLFRHLPLLILPAILIPLPWFLLAFFNTGNPFYPVFSGMKLDHSYNPLDLLYLFTRSPDPLSPIYIMLFPFIITHFRFFTAKAKIIGWYSLLALLIWFLTPRDNGGRFILPYLPVFSLLIGITINKLKDTFIKRVALILVIFLALISIGYRGVANFRYLPVILGVQTKENFLANNLEFFVGNYYDVEGKIKQIVGNEKVLIIGSTNLFYVNFPFVHITYAKPEERFAYILTQHNGLPEQYKDWKLVYRNEITDINLYNR